MVRCLVVAPKPGGFGDSTTAGSGFDCYPHHTVGATGATTGAIGCDSTTAGVLVTFVLAILLSSSSKRKSSTSNQSSFFALDVGLSGCDATEPFERDSVCTLTGSSTYSFYTYDF